MADSKADVVEGKMEVSGKPSEQNGAPLVFISHDTRDTELAVAFAELLRSVSGGVLKSFISSDKKDRRGIEYGTDWFPAIMNKLDEASDVVALLTRRSLDRPWILYEAGVARGKYDTPVLGLALGIPLERAQSGPFAQFQNSGDDIDSLTGLVLQLMRRIPGSDPVVAVVTAQVKTFVEESTLILQKLDECSDENLDESSVDAASASRLFEEVKIMFEDLPSRIDRRLCDVDSRNQRRRHFHPGLLEEMVHYGPNARNGSSALGWLIFISYLKDDYPWAYELGVEVFRALKGGRQERVRTTISDFREAVEFALHTPFLEEMGPRQRESLRLLDALAHSMEFLIQQNS